MTSAISLPAPLRWASVIHVPRSQDDKIFPPHVVVPAEGSERCLISLSDCHRSVPFVTGDNNCHLHEAAIRQVYFPAPHLYFLCLSLAQMARLGECELIYANFSNEVAIKPYAVFVDYETQVSSLSDLDHQPPILIQALVITVRGTLSLEDCITDAVAHPESLQETGELASSPFRDFTAPGLKYGFDGTDRYAHSGMLKAAAWIREDLFTHRRVAELLSFVAGPNPSGGTVYKDGFIDASQNISAPLLAQVLRSFILPAD